MSTATSKNKNSPQSVTAWPDHAMPPMAKQKTTLSRNSPNFRSRGSVNSGNSTSANSSVRRHRGSSKASSFSHNRQTTGHSKASLRSNAASGDSISTREHDGGWRKHGRTFRAQLILRDEKEGGGTGLVLSPQCPIEKYHQVADKVLFQFLQHPIDTREDMLEAYLVGTRLCKFLSAVLPAHPDYFSPEPALETSRERSQTQLIELMQYVEEIALIIDGDEHQAYISRVLDQAHTMDCDFGLTTKQEEEALNDTTLSSCSLTQHLIALGVVEDHPSKGAEKGKIPKLKQPPSRPSSRQRQREELSPLSNTVQTRQMKGSATQQALEKPSSTFAGSKPSDPDDEFLLLLDEDPSWTLMSQHQASATTDWDAAWAKATANGVAHVKSPEPSTCSSSSSASSAKDYAHAQEDWATDFSQGNLSAENSFARMSLSLSSSKFNSTPRMATHGLQPSTPPTVVKPKRRKQKSSSGKLPNLSAVEEDMDESLPWPAKNLSAETMSPYRNESLIEKRLRKEEKRRLRREREGRQRAEEDYRKEQELEHLSYYARHAASVLRRQQDQQQRDMQYQQGHDRDLPPSSPRELTDWERRLSSADAYAASLSSVKVTNPGKRGLLDGDSLRLEPHGARNVGRHDGTGDLENSLIMGTKSTTTGAMTPRRQRTLEPFRQCVRCLLD